MISTDKAVRPTSMMGASKRFAEMIVQSINENSKNKILHGEICNVINSSGSVIPLFRNKSEGGPLTITHKT